MLILGIDTSNQALAIGLIDNKILGQIQTTVKKNHSLTLMLAIEELCEAVGVVPSAIDRIAVAQGPGSYTGLRIGVTVAKTLAYTLKKELVGISSLKVVAANCINVQGWIIPIFDARRENVYAGIYQWEAGVLDNVVKDQHISFEALLKLIPEDQAVYFVGSDTTKFAHLLNTQSNITVNSISEWDIPSGTVLAKLAEDEEPIADVHGFLPNYLKRVEAEEKWLETHNEDGQDYVEKI